VQQPISKSSLSDGQSLLIELLQRLNFGRVEGLHVRNGEPVFDPAPRVLQKLKMGANNTERPEANLKDFLLKHQTIEMLQAIADLGEGEIVAIEVKNGLCFTLELERPALSTGVQRNA
jgi:hypothetical protein